MKSLVLFLAMSAWVLSCFDAVSYFRARDNERISEAGLAKASSALLARENAAENSSDSLRQKIEKDQAAVDADEQGLALAQKGHKNSSGEQQVLATDKAGLDADRIVGYDSQDYLRANPDPEVTAAKESLDTYRKSVAGSQANEARDTTLTRGLVVLWLVVMVLGFFAGKTRPAGPMQHRDRALV